MHRIFKILLSCILCSCLMIGILPVFVFAADSESVIDLSVHKDIKGKGYSWDYSKKQLILKNARLTEIIHLPAGCDVEILLEGENTVGGILRDYRGNNREEEFDTFDWLNQGNITIASQYGGSLSLNGDFQIYGNGVLMIDGCQISTENVHTSTDMVIKNNGRLIFDGYGYSRNLILDHGTLKNKISNDILSFSVNGNMEIKNDSILSLRDTSGKNPNESLNVRHDMTADYTSEVTVINTCTDDNSSAISFGAETRLILLLCEKLRVSSGGNEAMFIQNEKCEADIILPKKIRNNYHTFLEIQANQWYYTSLLDRDENLVTEIYSVSEEAAEQTNHIIKGVENTQLSLKSSMTEKGNIQLTWNKSPGFRVDYYEVMRSESRFSGYGTKPYYSTQSNMKTAYINTSVKAGTRYFYKVRGVREIDGQLYYTQWSNKAWRVAI